MTEPKSDTEQELTRPVTDRVNIVDDDTGETFSVKRENLQKALGAGYREETEEEWRKAKLEQEFGGVGGALAATALGAARSATFGASDWMLKAAGLDDEALAYAEANPTATTVGEVGGIVAPALASGGTSLLAKGAAKVGAGVIGAGKLGAAVERVLANKATAGVARKILASTARGATEGAAFGAGKLVSETALGREDLTAESVAAHVGVGALFGGAATGAFGAGAVASKAAAKKLMQPTEALGRALKSAAGQAKGAVREAIDPNLMRAGTVIGGARDARKVGASSILSAKGKRDAREFFGEKLKDLGIVNAGDGVEEIAKNAARAADEWGGKIGSTFKEADDAILAGTAAPKTTYVNRAGERVAGNAEEVFGRIEKEIIKPAASAKLQTKETKGVAREFARIIKESRERSGSGASLTDLQGWKKAFKASAGDWSQAPANARQAAYRKAYGVVNDYTDELLEQVAPQMGIDDIGGRLLAVKENYVVAQIAKESTEAAVFRAQGRSGLGLMDLLFGIGGASVTDAEGLGKLGFGVGALALGKFGRRYGPQIAAGLLDSTKAAARGRLQTLSGLEQAASSTANRITKAFRGIGEVSPAGVAVQLTTPLGDDYNQQRAKLKELSTPEGQLSALERLDSVAPAAPSVTMHMQELAVRAAGFLDSKAPKPPVDSTGVEQSGWEPSDYEIRTFNRYAEAVTNPVGQIEKIRKGQFTLESLEALQTVYPQLYQEAVAVLIDQLPEIHKKASYREKIAITTFTGAPAHPTLTPEFEASLQASFDATNQVQEPPPRRRVRGRVGLADKSMTRAERLAAR